MEREILASLLPTLMEEAKEALEKTIYPRDLHFPDLPNKILVAIGMRRSGKTFFLYREMQKLLGNRVSWQRILYLNFEDDRLLPLDQKGLATLIESFYTLYPENHDRICYLFLDEIQNVEGWAAVVRRFFDTKKVRIHLSCSSAKLLSREIASSLRGRSFAVEVWPYSFLEFLRVRRLSVPSLPFAYTI